VGVPVLHAGRVGQRHKGCIGIFPGLIAEGTFLEQTLQKTDSWTVVASSLASRNSWGGCFEEASNPFSCQYLPLAGNDILVGLSNCSMVVVFINIDSDHFYILDPRTPNPPTCCPSPASSYQQEPYGRCLITTKFDLPVVAENVVSFFGKSTTEKTLRISSSTS
jgi:hypothetical protein